MTSGPVRVLHIINSLTHGGAEQRVIHLAGSLTRSDFDTSVLCLYRRGELASLLDDREVPVQVLDIDKRFTLSNFRKVRRAIATARPDVVHAHLQEGRWYGIAASTAAGVPTRIAQYVNCPVTWGAKQRWADRVCSVMATSLVANSQAVSGCTVTDLRANPRKMHVVRGPFDLERYQRLESRERARADLNISPSARVVVCVGSLTAQKDHATLIEAFAGVHARNGDCLLLLAGRGVLEGPLRELVTRHSLDEVVRFLGPRDDIPRILAAADLFALTSRWEGLSTVLVEAGAAGLPAVATRVGGATEVIDDARTGLLVREGDVQAVEDALLRLISDPAAARAMGVAARAKVNREFDPEVSIRAFEQLYRGHSPGITGRDPSERGAT